MNGDSMSRLSESLKNLPEFPNLETAGTGEQESSSSSNNNSSTFDLKEAVGSNEGFRNDILHRAACSALSRNYDIDSALFFIEQLNQTFKPQLPNEEVIQIFN